MRGLITSTAIDVPFRREGPLAPIDPHRVQLFSFQEIWKGVVTRLAELNVLKDPDAKADDEDSMEENHASDASSDDFDLTGDWQ